MAKRVATFAVLAEIKERAMIERKYKACVLVHGIWVEGHKYCSQMPVPFYLGYAPGEQPTWTSNERSQFLFSSLEKLQEAMAEADEYRNDLVINEPRKVYEIVTETKTTVTQL